MLRHLSPSCPPQQSPIFILRLHSFIISVLLCVWLWVCFLDMRVHLLVRTFAVASVSICHFYCAAHYIIHLSNSPLSLTGGNFTLAELGVCEPSPPPHPAAVPYCPDLGLLQRGYSLSAGSDADSDPEGPLSPERAIQLWAGRGGVKSRRSSGVSSRENSALTLTDSENDKSDDESGRSWKCG